MTDGKWIYVSEEEQERLGAAASSLPVGLPESLAIAARRDAEFLRSLANRPGITEEEAATLLLNSVYDDPDPTCCAECSAQHKLRSPHGKPA